MELGSVSAYDLPTRDKLLHLQRLLPAQDHGLALDVGIGTGYLTAMVFRGRPAVCVDLDEGNLRAYQARMGSALGVCSPLCVLARATALPFKSGLFQSVLCSEVLEHVEDDVSAVGEISRVLAPEGNAVVTVPYSGLGVTSFLNLFGVKTVHDYPGPERHVRPGYDEPSLSALLDSHGLRIACRFFYLRLFTKIATDAVSLAHVLYQRLISRRRSWNWSDVASLEGKKIFVLYRMLFPILWAWCRLDRVLTRYRGFGLIVLAVKRAP